MFLFCYLYQCLPQNINKKKTNKPKNFFFILTYLCNIRCKTHMALNNFIKNDPLQLCHEIIYHKFILFIARICNQLLFRLIKINKSNIKMHIQRVWDRRRKKENKKKTPTKNMKRVRGIVRYNQVLKSELQTRECSSYLFFSFLFF